MRIQTDFGPFEITTEDTWYEIEIMYDLSGSNARAEMWVDGVWQGSWEGSGKPSGFPNKVRTGAINYCWGAQVWQDLYLDDIQCRDQKIGGSY